MMVYFSEEEAMSVDDGECEEREKKETEPEVKDLSISEEEGEVGTTPSPILSSSHCHLTSSTPTRNQSCVDQYSSLHDIYDFYLVNNFSFCF